MASKNLPETIVLLGPPGAGKGKQAALLARRFNFRVLETGNLLRTFVRTHRGPLAQKIATKIRRGDLVPSWLVFLIWFARLVKLPLRRRVIFDGSPRKIAEAHFLDEVLLWLGRKPAQAVLIEIPPRESFMRLRSRGRRDDAPQIVRKRLGLYRKEMIPIIKHFKKSGRLMRIDGTGKPKEVFSLLLRALARL